MLDSPVETSSSVEITRATFAQLEHRVTQLETEVARFQSHMPVMRFVWLFKCVHWLTFVLLTRFGLLSSEQILPSATDESKSSESDAPMSQALVSQSPTPSEVEPQEFTAVLATYRNQRASAQPPDIRRLPQALANVQAAVAPACAYDDFDASSLFSSAVVATHVDAVTDIDDDY